MGIRMTEKALYYPGSNGEGSINVPNLHFLPSRTMEGFDGFSPIVILGGTVDFVPFQEKEYECARIEREAFNSLQKGNVVCLTANVDGLMGSILGRIGAGFLSSSSSQLRVDHVVKRSEFLPFYQGFVSLHGHIVGGPFDDVICEDADKEVIGFAKKVDKGVLIALPCLMPIDKFSDYFYLDRFLNSLFDALDKYGPKIQYKPPLWIDSFTFPKEIPVLSTVQRLQNELELQKKVLEGYLRLKEILWFRNNELVVSVIKFFESMGLRTKREEKYEEDFWILDGKDEDIIVEVKGLDKNLTRQHISQLDEHRAAREKPDDFPALLVVNSFNRAVSLKEKNEAFAPNEIKKAVQTNVLLMRTFDLCQVFSMIEERKLNASKLIRIIKTEKGWLKAIGSALEIKHE
jgi:hypothetical protein